MQGKGYTRGVTKPQFGRLLHFLSIQVSPEDLKLIERKFESPVRECGCQERGGGGGGISCTVHCSLLSLMNTGQAFYVSVLFSSVSYFKSRSVHTSMSVVIRRSHCVSFVGE